MGPDRELEQLYSVYAERSDSELLDLNDKRDDLTDLAQQALAQVIRDRKLSVTGVPVSQPDLLSSDEKAATGPDDDEVELLTFDDAFRLNEALRVLTKAEIAHRVVNWDAVSPRRAWASGPRLMLGLIVGRVDEAHAKNLLQSAMKLYPDPENSDARRDLEVLTILGVFGRLDALLVAHALGSAGLSYVWNDGREDMSLEESEVRVEVYAQSFEQAHTLAKEALGE